MKCLYTVMLCFLIMDCLQKNVAQMGVILAYGSLNICVYEVFESILCWKHAEIRYVFD